MTTLADRPNTALVVIDLQNEVVANAYRRDDVLDAVRMLVERARAAGVPVVWVQHTDLDLKAGSEAWQIVAELAPAPDEPVVEKSYRDAFEDTRLEQVLLSLDVGKGRSRFRKRLLSRAPDAGDRSARSQAVDI